MIILKIGAKTLLFISLLTSQITYAAQTSRFIEKPGPSEMIGNTRETEDEEPLYEKLKQHFKKKYLSIGTWLRTDFEYQQDRNNEEDNGFEISRFRLTFGGELDGGMDRLQKGLYSHVPRVMRFFFERGLITEKNPVGFPQTQFFSPHGNDAGMRFTA